MDCEIVLKKTEHDLAVIAYKFLATGLSAYEVGVKLKDEESISCKAAADSIVAAYKLAEADYAQDTESVMAVHLLRYDAVYDRARSGIKELEGEDPETFAKLAPLRYVEVLEALYNKERLLGFHDRKVSINVSTTNIEVSGGIPSVDFSGFTLSELKDFRSLLDGCRSVPLEGIYPTVIMAKAEHATDTEGVCPSVSKETEQIVLPCSVVEDIKCEEVTPPFSIADIAKPKEELLNSLKSGWNKEEENILSDLLKK